MRVIILLCLSLIAGPVMSSETSLTRSQAALINGQYLKAYHLAEQLVEAGQQTAAAALVMARAADLGGQSRRRTEQLYLVALDKAMRKAPILGHLTLFYLRSGQTGKARDANAAFRASCRYNCAATKAQIRAAQQIY